MTGDPPDPDAAYCDIFASEYGWTIQKTMNMACDILALQFHAILARRGVRVFKVSGSASTTESLTERIRRIDAESKSWA